MATYKNIRIKMRGGKTRLQRVKVLASGKYKFVKNIKSSKKSTKNKTKKRKRTVAKRKKNKRKTSRRIPLSVIVGLTHSVFGMPNPGWGSAYAQLQAQNPQAALYSFIAAWTGIRLPHLGQHTLEFDLIGTLNPFDLRNAPAAKVMILTKLVTKVVRKLAGNPFTRIPFVKDYVSFG